MKARVIETGEIVEVNLYSSPYYKEKGQGYDRRGWYDDELEFITNPNRPKMVPLDKVCEYLKTLKFQGYPGAPLERLLDDSDIDALIKEFE